MTQLICHHHSHNLHFKTIITMQTDDALAGALFEANLEAQAKSSTVDQLDFDPEVKMLAT